MRKRLADLIVLVLALPLPVFAKKIHAPLPPQLLSAKTVCISTSTDQSLRDRAFQEISKAKYFTFATDCSGADVVFRFEIHSTGYAGGYPVGGGKTYQAGETTYAEFFSVVDSKTGNVLWSDSKQVGTMVGRPEDPSGPFGHSVAGELVKSLIQRIKEQRK